MSSAQSLSQLIVDDHTDHAYEHNHIRFLLHGGLQDLKYTGQNPKGILCNPSRTADRLIVDPLVDVHASAGEGFHQLVSEGEDVITNDKILHLGPVVHK